MNPIKLDYQEACGKVYSEIMGQWKMLWKLTVLRKTDFTLP